MGIAVQFLQIQMENALYASGAYIMTQKNAYQATFQRNPGFNETEKVVMDQLKLKILH